MVFDLEVSFASLGMPRMHGGTPVAPSEQLIIAFHLVRLCSQTACGGAGTGKRRHAGKVVGGRELPVLHEGGQSWITDLTGA